MDTIQHIYNNTPAITTQSSSALAEPMRNHSFLKGTSSGRKPIGSRSFMFVLVNLPQGLASMTGISELNSAIT